MTLSTVLLDPEESFAQDSTTQKSAQKSTQKCMQRVSADGEILVSRKAWIARFAVLAGIVAVIDHNLIVGLRLNDSIVVYSTLMPLHTFLVFAVGWIFFRNKTSDRTAGELVSVIIPIYNQESIIEQVVDAVYRSTYPNLEVIAVNDGSKDGTRRVLDSLAMKHPDLKVIHRKNAGKRRAVATGFYASRGRYIVLIDSDSVVDEHAIEELMKTFHAYPKAGGVVGHGKVLNAGENTLTKWQDAWYDYAFNVHKTCESYFGCVLCCSGCLAAYRREAIADFIPYWSQARLQNSDDRDLTSYAMATPWAKSELAPLPQKLMELMAQYDDAEDRGLTAATLFEWKTVYAPKAIVHTVVPGTVKGYLKQQTRWKKGYIRSSFFVSAFFWHKNPIMSLIFYLEFMSTFIAPIIIFAMYVYRPLFINEIWTPLMYIAGQILIGFAAGMDYKFRDKSAKYWFYKPLMNLLASIILPWLVLPALWTYRKNGWLTR